MRRLALIALALVALAAYLIVSTAAKEPGSYHVDVVYDSAQGLIKGVDVRVAGAKVGRVTDLQVTEQKRAKVSLQITAAGFKNFHQDAFCSIRLQSLIGEKYVQCNPGTPGTPSLEGQNGKPPLLHVNGSVVNGQRVGGTSSPVDLDLIQDIMRMPYRDRFRIILAELGTGVAGRGDELNDVIRRANPALAQTDRVLKILARQNRILADLVKNSDTVIQPLARDRKQVANFIVVANETAQASASQRGNIARSIRLLPGFLSELQPTMTRLAKLTDEMGPTVAALNKASPDLSRFIIELGPFSKDAIPAIQSLGDTADVGKVALVDFGPTATQLKSLGASLNPVSANLDKLTANLKATGGVDELLKFIFYVPSSTNGYDSISHYLRASLQVNLCSNYATEEIPGCLAGFGGGQVTQASKKKKAEKRRSKKAEQRSSSRSGGLKIPGLSLPGAGKDAPKPKQPRGGGPQQDDLPSGGGNKTGLLDYLMGSGS